MKKKEGSMTEKIESLKITVINDNEPGKNLKNDWGWSALIESQKWKILFDADTRNDVIENNIKALAINVLEINFAFLSHFHYDHYGGFEYIGRLRKGLKVYIPERDSILESWGLETIQVEKEAELSDNVYSTGPLGKLIKEHALVVKCDGFNVLVVGCSHPGIDKIARKAYEMVGKIHLVIGGFHGPSKNQLDKLAMISEHISPAHCSGDDAKNYVRENFKEKYLDVRTGSIIKLPIKL
ncbi:MAG: MBL fold metallo-hydrolase [Thermoplasmata archaeon]